jgi:hypothetical protein
MLTSAIATLDAILEAHAGALGDDFERYRHHTYRVANFCIALASCEDECVEKVAIAAAFHDLGIWTNGTFDYLPPSIRLAKDYLERDGKAGWSDEVEAMIREHHKITPYRNQAESLVEPFRRADWIDVSKGTLRFGLSRALIREAYRTWPGAGFHRRLVELTLQRARSHPLSPLPMMRL